MNIEDTLAPNSDQLDAVDLLGGARTFTVERVTKGSSEQPVQVHLAEFPRPWRPGKSMRRVLAGAWGADASTWTGHRLTLFCDETVVFGGKPVGGVRIAAMSHIDKPRSVPLIIARGKSAMFTVQPLPDTPTPADDFQPTDDEIAACDDVDVLKNMWRGANPERRARIEARSAELKGGAA